MTFKMSIAALFTLSLSASVIAENPVVTDTPEVSEKSFFDTLSDKKLTFSAGNQANTLEFPSGDQEFSGTYFAVSFMPVENFKISGNYYTTKTDTLDTYSLQQLWWQLPEGDDQVLLDTFGLDKYYDGIGITVDSNADIENYFYNSYFVSTSLEMNEFEVGVAYVANFDIPLSYNIYLGYISGEVVTNEKLSTKFIMDDYSDMPAALFNHIKNNDFTNEGTFSDGTDYKQQNYLAEHNYLYEIYTEENLNAHDLSNNIDYTTFVMKIALDYAVMDNLHLIAGIASESSSMDNVEENIQDTVYNIGALFTIWNGVGIEFNHQIYDGITKTSAGINYSF